jgi:hypothetical protein
MPWGKAPRYYWLLVWGGVALVALLALFVYVLFRYVLTVR